jgi:predicted urease superfamily metal-dependent hydrolase
MANLWEKVKQTIEDGAKTIKEGAESVAKTVSEKAPGIASNLVEKGKELADSLGDKAQEMMALGQLKVKHYNLNRDVSKVFAEIGGKVYELIKKDDKNIYANPDILKMIENVKKLELDIDALEKKMEEVKLAKNEPKQKPVDAIEPEQAAK